MLAAVGIAYLCRSIAYASSDIGEYCIDRLWIMKAIDAVDVHDIATNINPVGMCFF